PGCKKHLNPSFCVDNLYFCCQMTQSKHTSHGSTLVDTFRNLWSGLRVTWRHLKNATRRNEHKAISDPDYFRSRQGIATIQYPHELLPIPDNGRYRLHNE